MSGAAWVVFFIILGLVWYRDYLQKKKKHRPDFNEWFKSKVNPNETIKSYVLDEYLEKYIEEYCDPLKNSLSENKYASIRRTKLRIIQVYKPNEHFKLSSEYPYYLERLIGDCEIMDKLYREEDAKLGKKE